jgi:hypothetical protein
VFIQYTSITAISLSNINRLILVIEIQYVFSEVRTEFLKHTEL